MAQQQMGLFGPTPNELLQAQQAADQALALRQSQFAPGQGLMYQAASAGPALSEAKKMEELKAAVASQWDGNDPLVAYKIFAKEASARGLTQAAIGAATQIKAFEADREKTEQQRIKTTYEIGRIAAQTQEALRKAQQATAAKVPSLVQYQEARDAIDDALQTEQDPQVRTRLETRKKELDNYINKESTREPKDKTPPSVGQDREALAQDMFGTDFYSLTQEQKKVINDRYEKLVRSKTPNINIDTKDLYGFVRGANSDLAPIVKQVSTLDTALNLLNQQSSPFASRALEQQIASVFGDANKAREEIKALANTGSLDERIANNILNFLSGTKTDATKSDQLTVLRALRSKLGKDYENMATPLRSALEGNKNVDPNKVIPPFSTRFGGLPLSTTGQRTTKSGTVYTVE
jgi:hypothetical protein